MDFEKTAQGLLKELGGEGNISSVTHCMTRMRFVLKDEQTIDDEKIKSISGVMGIMKKGGQYQVIIGNDVAKFYKIFKKLGSFGGADNQPKKVKEKLTVKSVVNGILDTISGSMAPILPAIIGCGMVKIILVILDLLKVSNQLPTYQILTTIGDVGFYFLPILLAYTASKKMGTNSILAMTIVAVMVHPSLIALLAKGNTSFLQIPVTSASYTSSVIPALLSVWFLSKLEPLADKIFGGWTNTILKPLALLLICVPVTLIILAPLGAWIGAGAAGLLLWLQVKAGWLTLGILAALMPLIVMSGMHYAILPTTIANLGTLGYDTLLLPAMLASNLGQAAVSLAVSIRTKNKDLKAVASASAISAFAAGITEPGLYGVSIRLKKPLIASMIGSGVAGVFIGIVGLKTYTLATPSLLALPGFISKDGGNNIIFALIAVVISVVVSFIMTLVLGWEDPISDEDKEKAEEVEKAAILLEKFEIASPIQGKQVALTDVPDPTFSTGIMGQGTAVLPENGLVYAPFDGVVNALFPTGHAIGLLDVQTGAELLIHVGLETVNLKGEGFTAEVKEGDTFKKGDVLIKFDLDLLKAKGFDTIVPVIVMNSNQFGQVDEIMNDKQSVDNKDSVISVSP